jgi:hypothetical protein
MSTFVRAACLIVLASVIVACGGPSPSAVASGSPNASPSPSTGAFGAIDHATGPTDVLLRYEQGGGFVMPAFLATQAPIFTLYGDGTIIFRNPAAESPPAVGAVRPFNPFRIAKLSEAQIQAILERALGQGGLGAARANYTNDGVADASTAVFTVDAGGLQKTVSIYALGIEGPGVQDAISRAAFQKLAERLGNFDDNGAFATQVYTPAQYRGVMMDGFPGDAGAVPWPWKDPQPEAFVMPANPNAFQMATHLLTAAQVEALGIDPHEGGFQGLNLTGPKGKLYSLSVRPLLPDEMGSTAAVP